MKNKKKYPNIANMLDVVFYDYWDEEYENADANIVLSNWLKSERVEELQKIEKELQDFLKEADVLSKSLDIFTKWSYCQYDPEYDGLTRIEWLVDIKRIVTSELYLRLEGKVCRRHNDFLCEELMMGRDPRSIERQRALVLRYQKIVCELLDGLEFRTLTSQVEYCGSTVFVRFTEPQVTYETMGGVQEPLVWSDSSKDNAIKALRELYNEMCNQSGVGWTSFLLEINEDRSLKTKFEYQYNLSPEREFKLVQS